MTESADLASPVTADELARAPDARSNPALELAQRAATFLSPGDLVLEVGLTAAEQPSLIARLCRAHVIVLEPDPERAALLDEHIARQGLGAYVEVRGGALGAQTKPRVACSARALTITLDDLALPSPPRLITIGPVESAVEILRGAEHLIRAHRPWVHVQTPNAVQLGTALMLLGAWGYEPRGQIGPSANLLCIPIVSVVVNGTALAEQGTAASYSDLGSRNEQLRQLTITPRDPPSDAGNSAHSSLIELARQMERLNVMLAQQLGQSRRLEAQFVTLRRRLESVITAGLPRKVSVTRRRGRTPLTSNTSSRRMLLRKLGKLTKHPSAFFSDSKHPVLRIIGRGLFGREKNH